MNQVIVTIIIATYNRPDTLKAAIRSVLNQTLKNWKLLVIGDNCDDRTDMLMMEYLDPRIQYFNLPERFGEQSGPNSVGLSLVETPYVSFLNHDDIWLQDHLEVGIQLIEKGNFDFFIGGTAFSRYANYSNVIPELVIDEINIENRSPLDFFYNKTNKFEPASSWIIKQAAVKKIGLWNYYTDLYRTPIEDYLLRAWRSKCTFYFSSIVTTWNIGTQYNNNSLRKCYDYKSIEHSEIIVLIESNSAENTRLYLNSQLNKWNLMSLKEKLAIKSEFSIMRPEASPEAKFVFFRTLMSSIFKNRITAYIYYFFGIDFQLFILMIHKNKKGSTIKSLISTRTGSVPPKPDLLSVISRLKKEPLSY